MTPRSKERWLRAYVEAPELFDEFCRAEDPDGRIVRAVIEHARLVGLSALEIGCGTGRYCAEWAPHALQYVAVEREPEMLALARSACARLATAPCLVCADAALLPFPASCVDLVLAGWVVVNLVPDARRRVLDEAQRVIRPGPGAGIWLVENDAGGEFQELRGRDADRERERIDRLVDRWGFSVVERVSTELHFSSTERAEHVLGWLCGDDVRDRLRERPRSRFTHDVLLLHRPMPGPAS